MPNVSVVIPVFNGGDLLAPCLDSVLAQNVRNFELIVVDDASTDSTPQTLARYAASDDRIWVLTHTENVGAGASRNDGMAAATGEFILFLDADDVVEPTLLKRTLFAARNLDADIVLFGADVFEGNDLSQRYPNPYLLDTALIPNVEPFNHNDIPKRFFQLCTPETWTKLFRRSFIEREQLRFQHLSNANDLSFTCTAMAKAYRMGVIPSVLVHHRLDSPHSVQSLKDREPAAFLDALWDLKASLVQAGLFEQLETSFANLALFHCLYNDAAPLDWPIVFSELGILQHPHEDFYLDGDYDRCAEIVLDCGIDDLSFTDACDDFWYTYAKGQQERFNQMRERAEHAEAQLKRAEEDAHQAQEEIDLIHQSRSYRLGTSLTSVPRKLRSNKESES